MATLPHFSLFPLTLVTPHLPGFSPSEISMASEHPRCLPEDGKHQLWGSLVDNSKYLFSFSQQFRTKPHPVPFNALSRFS